MRKKKSLYHTRVINAKYVLKKEHNINNIIVHVHKQYNCDVTYVTCNDVAKIKKIARNIFFTMNNMF